MQRFKSLVPDDLVVGGGVSSGALRRCESHVPRELHKITKRIRFMTEKGRFCRVSWRRSGQTSIQKRPKFRVPVLLIYKPSSEGQVAVSVVSVVNVANAVNVVSAEDVVSAVNVVGTVNVVSVVSVVSVVTVVSVVSVVSVGHLENLGMLKLLGVLRASRAL